MSEYLGMSTGLTLGKFAPLHRGHQFVIETALRETDHVIVLVYPAEETSIPLAIRAKWIKSLYPNVEVIEAWEGPTQGGYTSDLIAKHDEYLTRLLHDRCITHFYSSEPYGEHVSRALCAVDRRVDPHRTLFPVSGTAVRHDLHRHRRLIDPLVYRDLVVGAVVVGAPSTGKTTLATALAKHFNTSWVPEYGREYWEMHNVDRRLTLDQLVEIAHGHRGREDHAALDARDILFIDTEAIVTQLFSKYYHGEVHPELQRMADSSPNRYDLFFLCDTDIPYADTPDRSGEANRSTFQAWMIEEMKVRRIPYVTLTGTLEERVSTAAAILDGYRKFTSVADHLIRLHSSR